MGTLAHDEDSEDIAKHTVYWADTIGSNQHILSPIRTFTVVLC